MELKEIYKRTLQNMEHFQFASHVVAMCEESGIEMLETQVEQFICGVSVRPNLSSEEEDWDQDDDVTANGSNLTIAREKAATAMIGTATATINQYPEQTVLFTMKHVGCRLRTRILCQKHIPAGITATIGQTAANQVPASVVYDPITQNYTPTYGTITSGAFSLPASTEEEFTASNYGKDYSYTSIGDYQYFLPTTNTSKVALSFTGGTLLHRKLERTENPKHPSLAHPNIRKVIPHHPQTQA